MGDVADAAGDLFDGLTGNSANEDARKEQQYGSQRAQGALRDAYNVQKEDWKPWQAAGVKALAGLEDPNFMKDFQGDPGYQFRLSEGEKAINNAASARGMGNSGATLKALTRFGQDFASNEYNNAYNRNYKRLSDLTNLGQRATVGLADAHQNFGTNMANSYTGYGNAMASSQIAQANRMSNLWEQGIRGGASAYMGMPMGGGGGAPQSQAPQAGQNWTMFNNIA